MTPYQRAWITGTATSLALCAGLAYVIAVSPILRAAAWLDHIERKR